MKTIKTAPNFMKAGFALIAATLLLTACQSGAGVSNGHSETVKTDIFDAHALKGAVTVSDVQSVKPVEHPQAPSLPAKVKGNDGQETTVSDISRIVVLDIHGSIGQTVIGLGLADKVVGRTTSDTSPELAKAVNVTAKGHNLNVESLLALKPSVVITDTSIGSADTVSVLRSSGVPVVVLDQKRNKSLINQQIETIGQALGVPDSAKQLIAKTDAQMRETTEYIHQLAGKTNPKLKAAFVFIRGNAGVFSIFGKGKGSDELLADLGLEDVAVNADIQDSKPANSELLLRLNPEIMIVMQKGLESVGGIDGLLKRPGVGQTVAGLNKRIIDMEDGQILAFGPAYPYTLRALAEAIYTKGTQ